jgi:hypothetical protein
LVLSNAVLLTKSAPLVQSKSGLGCYELQYPVPGIAHHNIHELSTDTLALVSLVHQNQSHRCELLAVGPPRGRTQHVAIGVTSGPAPSQPMVKLPILLAVRPAFRLTEPQSATEIVRFQASKSDSTHQK